MRNTGKLSSCDNNLTYKMICPLSAAHLRVLSWQPFEMPEPEGTVIVAHDATTVSRGDLLARQEMVWEAPVEPGEYALSLFSAYEGRGDLSYGWHIVVE